VRGLTARSLKALEPELLDLSDPARPRLIGARCQVCGERYFPRRHRCAKASCLGPCAEIRLAPTGTLYTWTYVHTPKYGRVAMDTEPFLVGQVDLDDGPRVQSILRGDPDALAIGMRLRLDLDVVREGEGEAVVTYCFVPTA
jgi:uncharacterized OB-fold protein